MIIVIVGILLTIIFFVTALACFMNGLELEHSEKDFDSLDKKSDTYEEAKTKMEKDNKKSEKWGVAAVFFLILSFVSFVGIVPLNIIDEKYAKETIHTISGTVVGKRSVIVNRGCGEDYYISCSDGNEYEVSGHDYSVANKGDTVEITQHIITGCISGDHYDWNDCEVIVNE